MRYIWKILGILFLFALVSCNGVDPVDPPPPPPPSATISVDKTSIGVGFSQSEHVIKVSSNGEWTVEGATAWCNVDKKSGIGDGQIVITIDKNTTNEQRKASLIFKAKMPTKADFATIVVIQNEAGGIIISDDEVEVERQGGEFKVDLSVNVKYNVVCSEPWVKLVGTKVDTKALVPDSKNFVVEPTTELVKRTAMVIFKDVESDVADTLYLSQKPTGTPVAVTEKAWDGEFRGDIFYEIFPRSFADSDGDKVGDLKGIADKLQYIKDLGCNGIWLTPINPSPSYHGYDVTDYKGINSDFGTMADFDALVSKANGMGMKVVLDFVINHSSNQHPWFVEAAKNANSAERGYYMFAQGNKVEQMCKNGDLPMIEDKKYNSSYWKYVTSDEVYYAMFDKSMPDLNYGALPNLNPVYDKILDAAKFWMSKGVAGLRLDAVKHIYQDEKSPQNWEFLNRFYTDVKSSYPDVYMVGEVLSGMDLTAPYFKGLPSLFHFDSWWKLEWSIQNQTGRYYAKDMVEAIGKFKQNRSDFNACIKLSNHDEDRAISKIGNNVDKAKVAFAVIATTPGQPYIYYGEEIGMFGMKDNDDKNVREPMLWGDSYYAKWFEPKNSTESRLDNVNKQLQNDKSLLKFYQEFAKLRNSMPSLAYGTINYPDPESVPNELMVYNRIYVGESVMVVVNVSDKTVDYNYNGALKNVVKAHNGAKVLKMQSEADGYVIEMAPLSVLVVEI